MHPLTFLLLFFVLLVIGLSVFGLFNKRRSLIVLIANVLVMAGAGGGALHAIGEGPSIAWAIVYMAILATGFASLIRQIILKKSNPQLDG